MKDKKLHIIYLSIIALLLIVIVGGAVYFHKQREAVRGRFANSTNTNGGFRNGGMRGMGMASITPPPLSDQQNEELTNGTATNTTKKTFNLTAGNFFFAPNKITVNKGDQVTFVMTNVGGMHDLVIDELGVKTAVIPTGQTVTATFTASKSGTFTFYCSVPGHRQKGMTGTITVQ